MVVVSFMVMMIYQGIESVQKSPNKTNPSPGEKSLVTIGHNF